MRSSLAPALPAALLTSIAFSIGACTARPAEPMRAPAVDGVVEVDGLSAPVRIVRDRSGVPHVFAAARDDVFFGQGFVQAQERLFQLDVWRRSAQGRLAEVLGANFIERDAMTRRLQFHGGADADWARYGPETRPIAEAFVRGVNAWVAIARARIPESFALAGWAPTEWTADDLLTRTDAYDRAATIEAAARGGLPAPVVDAVRRAAAPVFFTGLARAVGHVDPAAAAPVPRDADVVSPVPSPLYFVHLHTPQWNAIGATPPWRPGLGVGHDDRASFARPEARRRAVVRAEPLDPRSGRILADAIAVKGREEPFRFETQVTARGVVIATDRDAGRQDVLDWDGFQPGRAPAFDAPERSPGTRVLEETPARSAPVFFEHLLGITANARRRFNLGPFERKAAGRRAAFLVEWQPGDWDASRGLNAPGQSEWRDSPHYADHAALWAAGGTVPLLFSEAAVAAGAESTLTLGPRRRR
jgi:penicillin amidase